ncbi:MAG: hypothetical protein JNK23_17740 [Opitutaceae bacterium]|nr:hypothetical protein [Opitutaceae bacterium]
MITGPALRCPKCRRKLEAHMWHSATAGRCGPCLAEFEFVPFPALAAAGAAAAPQAVLAAEESVCFFHAENRAEAVCADCGRLVCAVCAIDFGGRRVCPRCVAGARESAAPTAVRQRATFDGAALSVALLPLLLWPFTFVTAPFALGLAIYGWNKPGSIVRGPRRWRLVLAGVIALAQIGGWIALIVAATSAARR